MPSFLPMAEESLAFQKRLGKFAKVLSTKASIAQTPKELIWTLNKARLYRYTPVLPSEKRHPVPLLLVFAEGKRPEVARRRRRAVVDVELYRCGNTEGEAHQRALDRLDRAVQLLCRGIQLRRHFARTCQQSAEIRRRVLLRHVL